MTARTRALGVAGALLLAAGGARAQSVEFGGAVWGAGVKARSIYPGVREALSGPVLGFDARVSMGRWGVRLGYGQGKLEPDTLGPDRRDYVDGFFQIVGSPLPGLELGIGPYARAYVTDLGTQRWAFWQLRARYEAVIITPDVSGYADLWTGFAGSANVAEAYDGSRGGSVGVRWRVARFRGSPLRLTLGYLIDEAWAGGGAYRETVERTWLALGIGRM